MLQSLLAYARGAGVDARWLTIGGNEEFFEVTKRIHNRLHGAPGDGGELGKAEHLIYESALRESASELAGLSARATSSSSTIPRPRASPAHQARRGRRRLALPRRARPAERVARQAWAFLLPLRRGGRRLRLLEGASSGRGSTRKALDRPSLDRRLLAQEPGAGPRRRSTSIWPRSASARTTARRRSSSARTAAGRGSTGRPRSIRTRPIPPDAPLVAQVSRWDRLKDPVGVLRCFAEHCDRSRGAPAARRPVRGAVADDPEGARCSPRFATARALAAGRGESGSTSPVCRWTTSRRTQRSSTRSSAVRTSSCRRASRRDSA